MTKTNQCACGGFPQVVDDGHKAYCACDSCGKQTDTEYKVESRRYIDDAIDDWNLDNPEKKHDNTTD